jgi:hypothetical protein
LTPYNPLCCTSTSQLHKFELTNRLKDSKVICKSQKYVNVHKDYKTIHKSKSM